MIETYTVKSLILLVISGVLAGNFALEKLMGAALCSFLRRYSGQ